jgi:hypothetical protein
MDARTTSALEQAKTVDVFDRVLTMTGISELTPAAEVPPK